jgi:hypothetical protein
LLGAPAAATRHAPRISIVVPEVKFIPLAPGLGIGEHRA